MRLRGVIKMKRIFILLFLAMLVIPVIAEDGGSHLMVGTEPHTYDGGSHLMVGTTPAQENGGIVTAVTTAIETLFPEPTLESQIDLNPGITTSGNSQVVMDNGVVTFNGGDVSVTTSATVNGYNFKPSSTVSSGNTLEWQTGETMWFVVPDPVVKFKYDYNGSVLKETIVLKEDRDISFPITIAANSKFEKWEDGYRIIRDTREDVFSKTWIQIQKPYGVDAAGKYITMDYAYDGSSLSLVYDREGIEYPLTIDPTYYLSGYNSYLKLLMHFNETTPSDEQGHSVTSTGGITLNTTIKKFGAGSAYFPSAETGKISIADSSDWNFGTGDWTVTYWTYPGYNTTSSSSPFIYYWYLNSTTRFGIYNSVDDAKRMSYIGIYGVNGGTVVTKLLTADSVPVGQWSQITVVKSGTSSTNIKVYINGTQSAMQSVTGSMYLGANATPYVSGGNAFVGTTYVGDPRYNGNLDELAVWKGVAIPIEELYPCTKTTAYATEVGAPINAYLGEYHGYLKANLHMNGTAGSTTFIDETGRHTWTPYNTASLVTTTQKFGSASSKYLNTSHDYLSTPASSDFNMTSKLYTISFWYKRTDSDSPEQIILGSGDSGLSGGSWFLSFRYNALRFAFTNSSYFSNSYYTTNTFIDTTSWHHVALILNGTHINLYHDGVLQPFSSGDSSFYTPYPSLQKVSIGRAGDYDNLYFNGNLDEVQFWKDVAIPISKLYPQNQEVETALSGAWGGGSACVPKYTVGSYAYCDGQQFTVTAAGSSGTLSGYQVAVNVSNMSGISSTTMIYTNGTTRPDWTDVVFTDSSNNRLNFWKENNTETSTTAYFWVRYPTVATSGTTGRVYYGNASQLVRLENGYSTFEFFDDFEGSTYNVSQFYTSYTGGGTVTYANSYLTFAGTGSDIAVARTNATFSVNNATKGYISMSGSGTISQSFGYSSPYRAFIQRYPSYSGYYIVNQKNVSVDVTVVTSKLHDTNYHTLELIRNGTTTIETRVDNIRASMNDTGVTTDEEPIVPYIYGSGSGMSVHWIFDRKYSSPEPTLSGFTAVPTIFTPTASFTKNSTGGSIPLAVAFTDTSTNTPTAWQWTLIPYSNGTWINWSTSQNPTLTISEVGNYSVMLSASNAYGASNTSPVGSWVNTSLPTLTAAYTASINPVATGSNVSFNWSGTGTPITYDYGFGDGSANESTRNVSHKYSLPGTYYTFLRVTDMYGTTATYTSSETVYNATGDNNQPIVMAPQFALTIHLTDSSNGLPIPVTATVTNTATGTSNTTVAGTTTLFSDYAIAAGVITAEGYQARAFSVVVDSNMEATYQLTKSSTVTQNANAVWQPYAVAIQVIDGNMNPITGVNINLSAYNSSLPGGLSGAVSYFKDTYGVPEDTASAMLNSSTYYAGTTDDYGFISTQVVSVIQYRIVTEDVNGVPVERLLWPHGSYYQINTGNSSTKGLIQEAEIQNDIYTNSKYNATFWEPNSTYGCMSVQAYDHTGNTNNVSAWWKLVDNGTIWWQNSTFIGGYGPVNQTKCVLIVPYQQWKWGGITD